MRMRNQIWSDYSGLRRGGSRNLVLVTAHKPICDELLGLADLNLFFNLMR